MRVVFAGTPAFSIPALSTLLDAPSVDLVGIYTQPDRPAGRGRECRASAVKEFVLRHDPQSDLPLFQPDSLKNATAAGSLSRLKPDLMVVAAYGLLLPPAMLSIARLGCVNLHASLLPRWRGAAPIERAIEAGDANTGISLMRMVHDLDAGPVLAGASLPIAADDTGGSLRDKLARLAGELLAANLPALAAGALEATSQDENRACYARKLDKADARLDWRLDAAALERKIRAFNPWPMASVELNGMRLRVWRATADLSPVNATCGEIVRADKAGIAVAAGDGTILLREVQKPGGKPMSAAALLAGMNIARGMRFAVEQ